MLCIRAERPSFRPGLHDTQVKANPPVTTVPLPGDLSSEVSVIKPRYRPYANIAAAN